ncbi:MAG: hypothetical protein NVS2B7_29820 [Herpetosiphon sp.]
MTRLAQYPRGRLHDLIRPALMYAQSIFAATMLLVIIFATSVMWPIPHLGFAADAQTFVIRSVVPGTAADQAGLHVGDRIITLYDQPVATVLYSVRIANLIGPHAHAIPIVIDRSGQVLKTTMEQNRPSFAFQSTKVAMMVVALLCWLAGYELGVVRRHEAPNSSVVAVFWLGISGVLGSLIFARYTAPPIYAGLLWLLISVFVPLAIYVHLVYPARQSGIRPAHVGRYFLFASFLVTSSIAILAYSSRMSMITLIGLLSSILPFEILAAVAIIGWILFRVYRRTTVARTRRHIRLIIAACLAITLIWFLLLIVPKIAFGYSLISGTWLVSLTALLPLAYLLGGLPDLYRADRLAMRSLTHLLAASVLVAVTASGIALLHLAATWASFWIAVAFFVCYRPVQHGLLRLSPVTLGGEEPQALDQAIQELAHSLEAPTVAATLIAGVRGQFGEPALAVFLGDVEGTNILTLHHQERMAGLPITILPGKLVKQLRQSPSVTESRIVREQVREHDCNADENQLLSHPAIVLWCPIWHTEGYLLGLLVLGMRRDLDPYRVIDVQRLRRLVTDVALAFAQSAAYAQRQESEATIRELYHQLQQSQEETARTIAQELHDEIINVYVRLNMQSLQKIASRVIDPDILAELALVQQSEADVISALRTVCERLHPTGLDDPLGLPGVLEVQLEKVVAAWPGKLGVHVSGQPYSLAFETQRESLQLAKEAVTNAIKHAGAQTIVVTLQYPTCADDPITLMISDDGCGQETIVPKAGHWGIKGMQERARALGGTLHFHSQKGQGTCVVCTFPVKT